jgi:hypothetical protein
MQEEPNNTGRSRAAVQLMSSVYTVHRGSTWSITSPSLRWRIADELHETGNVSAAEQTAVNTHINGTHIKRRMYVIADVRYNRVKRYSRKYTIAP